MTSPEPRRRARAQRSLRQEYAEFILQRIEEFKQQISREELLAIADEAVRELEVGSEEQLVLTEVLVLEHVDRLITRRLNLPSFRRWRDRHVKLRRAQREPTHWRIDADAPIVELAQHLPDDGLALVIGASATPTALFLAAYDWPVLFIDQELASVEAAETRAAAEALAWQFQALVVSLGDWFPEVRPVLSIIDPGSLARLDGPTRGRFLDTLTTRTIPGGVHCVLPAESRKERFLTPKALKTYYSDWRVERPPGAHAARWLVAVKR